MRNWTPLPKPKHRLKKMVEVVENCIFHNHCQKCGYKKYSNCKELLMCDMLYYLRMVLEKSEKGQTHENN